MNPRWIVHHFAITTLALSFGAFPALAQSSIPDPGGQSLWEPVAFLFFFALSIAWLVLVVVAWGLLALIGLFLATIVVAVAVGSTAVVVGIVRRSVISGLRTLFLLSGMIVGAGAGSSLAAMIGWLFDTKWSLHSLIEAGGGYGALAGLLGAILFNAIWTGALRFVLRWLGASGDPLGAG